MLLQLVIMLELFGNDGFEDIYINNGRLAGSYTRSDTDSNIWVMR